jgi:hypothetical protein
VAVNPVIERYCVPGERGLIHDKQGWGRYCGLKIAGKKKGERTENVAVIGVYGPTKSFGKEDDRENNEKQCGSCRRQQ